MHKINVKLCFWFCFLTSIRATTISVCDYFDTVDLTGSKKFANGSYEYKGVIIPAQYTDIYNYRILSEGTYTPVDDHTRGCVCKFKSCIRYCCHRHRLAVDDEQKCIDELTNTRLNITLDDGTQIEEYILEQFVVQPGIRIQCNEQTHIKGHSFKKNDDWKLFENGTLYRSNDAQYLSKRDYCIQPDELAKLGQNFKLLPMNCLKSHEAFYINLVSICILLLTICIYVFVLKLKHIHDKCYLCYLICLSISLLVNIVTSRETFLYGASCYFVAYLGYFSSFCIYLWLTVISFDLWQKLVVRMFEVIESNMKVRFRIYSLVVWSTATVFLLLTILADNFLNKLDIDVSWKIGYLYYECFAKLTDLSLVVFFFGPVGIMVASNVAFVSLTAKHIYTENRKTQKQLQQLGQRNNKKTLRFTIYLRFFIIAISDWIIELTGAIYYNLGSPPAFFLYIMYYLGLVHCILVFMVTVFRKDVLRVLTKWVLKAGVGKEATTS